MTPLARVLLFLPMAVVLAAFGSTFAGLVWSSLGKHGVALYVTLLSDPGTVGVVWRTAWVAAATTAVCVALGYPLALFLAASPRRNAWLLLVISPWLVSIVVRSFGWMVLLGVRGPLNGLMQRIGLIAAPVRMTSTPGAIIVGLVHVLLPFMVIAILSNLLQLDRQLDEACRILGGTRWQAFRRVTLPLSLPGLSGGCTLVLLLSAGAIVTPLFLGGLRDRVLGTEIYTDVFQVFDFDRAAATAVLLLAVSLLLVAPFQLLDLYLRRTRAPSVSRLGRNLVAGFALVMLPLPLLVVIGASFSARPALTFPPTGFSLRWYAAFLGSGDWMTALATSAGLALAVTVITVAISIMAALALERARPLTRALAETAILGPLLFPHAAIGIGILGWLIAFRMNGTLAGIFAAHLILCTPFTYRPIAVSLRQLDASLPDAAMILGASQGQVIRRVVLPLLRPGIVAALLFGFIVSLDEVTVTLFLVGPDVTTLPVSIYAHVADSADPVVAAISTLLIAFTAGMVLLLQRLVGLGIFIDMEDERPDAAGGSKL